MLCIIAFVIFLTLFPILGFFPNYRKLFARAWDCVFKKITLKPCDINLGDELKNKLLGKLVFRYPKITKFLDKTFGFWAFLFAVINIWSIATVAISGLNLYVYGTCNSSSGESCSLSGEACGVASSQVSFDQAVRDGKYIEWATSPLTELGKTISRVPSRLKKWQAEDYLAPKPTYYQKFDPNKQTALEIIDPSCSFCSKLFKNIKKSNFQNNYNLTYVLYPIPEQTAKSGYKFPASYLISSYIEASKQLAPASQVSEVPADWQLLEIFFVEEDINTGQTLQEKFNFTFSKTEYEEQIQKRLTQIGYSKDQLKELKKLKDSKQVSQNLDRQRQIVEEEVRTIRIPTVIFDGRRFDRVLKAKELETT